MRPVEKRACVRMAVFLLFFTICLWMPSGAGAETGPVLHQGKKWRIGYYEGGPYSDYAETMRTLIAGLCQLGWIQEQRPAPVPLETPKPYWKWLTEEAKSGYLSFRAQDGYSAGWDEEKRAQCRAQLLEKLRNNELDLVIAMGTWAGQDLANDRHRVPTVVLSTSNPIQAGIIENETDSGLDHVTARVDPDRYLRQIRMFHRIAKFRKLGVAIESTPLGPIYSAIDEVNRVAAERGFEVVICMVPEDAGGPIPAADQSCLDCFRHLARNADAVYVTALTCVDRNIASIVELLRTERVPSFSMTGSRFVEAGLMFSISSDAGYEAQGMFNAKKIAQIFNGAPPRSLAQRFPDPLDIAVNMETAHCIGFDMPSSILKIAREVYGDK